MRFFATIIVFSVIAMFYNQHCQAQTITTIAGDGTPGDDGDGGPAIAASLSLLAGSVCDKHGNCYIIERYTNKIRMINADGIISTVAGNGTGGYSGDGGTATLAQLNNPTGIAVDTIGNIYIADFLNHRIRKVDTLGIIYTVAGNGIDSSGTDGGLATSTAILPSSVCLDDIGNIYITDTNAKIRKIDTNGIITTIAGNGIQGYSGDEGLAINAEIEGDRICTDANNNLYIACIGRIRKVDVETGIISTVAGDGNPVYNGDDIYADSAQFDPRWITFDPYGNLYIADYGNQRIRKIDASGIIHTLAGNGTSGYAGDGGAADSAEIYGPEGVAVDSCGNVYIADKNNYRVRKIIYSECNYLKIINISIKKDISIYPNPAYSNITINSNDAITSITIINLLGQIVFKQQYSNGNREQINIANLPSGVYFIKVDNSYVQKMVKE